ncbi:MAG: HNH endonuclease signature motif containing protein, partial [Acidimicrobiales bacterium]
DHHDRPAKRRHAPHVSLVVTPVQLEDGLAGRTMCGRTIAGPDVATLCCDSVLRRVALADGEVLQLGRTTKAVPAYLAHTVAARDRHCRFPACDRLAKYTDVHHVVPWWNGGSTDITNLVLLCRRHHRRLHTPGWRATLARDATLTITAPHAAAA